MDTIEAIDTDRTLEIIFAHLSEVSRLREHSEIIEILAKMAKLLTNSDRCTVWVVGDDRATIWTKEAQGMDSIEIPIFSGIVGDAIARETRVIIDDVYKEESFNPNIDKQTGYRTKSMMVIPMFDYNDEVIGAFQVINRQGKRDTYDELDMKRLVLASAYGAETLLSAKLLHEIEETQREVVITMGSIGESRSKETGYHVIRVAEYSRILALKYGLSEEEAELLKSASPMHDIGKVAIPDAVLNKPGRFNPHERDIMNTHAEIGYNLLKSSTRELMQTASIVAYEHHERWDGKGYPRGLEGEHIDIFGRITAIADVFDALGSPRVYKPAWDDERIFKLFKEERGKQFDPKLIDIFFENIDEILAVRDKFTDKFEKVQVQEITPAHVQILGAYGGRSKDFGTSSFLINRENVIDAGHLLQKLQDDSIYLENIWLTHSHLDHINDLAYILDNYYTQRTKTLKIIALPETIETLKESIFNNSIWPDFSQISLMDSNEPTIIYEELMPNKIYELSDSESIMPFKVDHTVPTCGYVYKKDNRGILFSSDTHSLDSVIKTIDEDSEITSALIECSFLSSMEKLAIDSKHLTPKLLFSQLESLKRDDISLYINHIKPEVLHEVIKEIDEYRGKWSPKVVEDNEIINF